MRLGGAKSLAFLQRQVHQTKICALISEVPPLQLELQANWISHLNDVQWHSDERAYQDTGCIVREGDESNVLGEVRKRRWARFEAVTDGYKCRWCEAFGERRERPGHWLGPRKVE